MQAVKANTCAKNRNMSKLKACYGSYHHDIEDREEIRGGITYTDLRGPLFGFDYWGTQLPPLQHYYAGGYLEYLTKSSGESTIRKLKNENWLSKGARLLLVDLQIYSPSSNHFIFMRLGFEISGTGGVTTSTDIRSLIVEDRIEDADEIFYSINKVLFALTVGFLIIEKIYEIITIGQIQNQNV